MIYNIYSPSAELQPFIKCFWTLEAEATSAPEKQRVVPDGCMEMIFHYGDLYRQFFEDGSSVIQPRCFVFGQISSYIEIQPTGASGIISARFLPDGLAPFLNQPVTELENKAVSIASLFGDEGRNLEEKVLSAGNTQERLLQIETYLLSRLSSQQTMDNITKSCVETIMRTQGQLDVIELADKLNIHRRNLERKFNTAIGMSPKQLSKVIRLQAALKMLGQNNFTSLTALAHENGYYDQAHFIKDFKEFTGLNPKAFFSANMKLSSLFAAGD